MMRTFHRMIAAGAGLASCVVLAVTLPGVALGSAAPAAARVSAPRSTSDPAAWGSLIAIDAKSGPAGGLTSVSCASPSFCAAVDVKGNVLTFDGTTWSRPHYADSDEYGLTSVSCPTTRFCFAADATGAGIKWNGKAWSAPSEFDSDPAISPPSPTVSCPTAHFCAAVDNFGYALVWRGTSWTHTVLTDQSDDALDLTGISCTSSTFCAAVDTAGNLITWNGSAWSTPGAVDRYGELVAISCVSSRFCVGSGAGAVVFRYNGKIWSAAASHISAVATVSVSCIATSFCVAGDIIGRAYHWNGSRWLSFTQPSPDEGLTLSCSTSSFCAGVTAGGAGVFYGRVPQVATSSLPAAEKDKTYSARIRGSGGKAPYSFVALSLLPRGLKLASNGLVSGTPKVSGHFSIDVRVSDPLRLRSSRRVSLSIG